MRLVFMVLAIGVGAGNAGAEPLGTEQNRYLEGGHVRSEDPQIEALIERGQARSATFRRLVAELNGSDVVVHVLAGRLPHGIRGQLRHTVVTVADLRYLFVTVDARAAAPLAIAIIGHELQHALEVARAPEVGRTARIDDFFAKIADNACRSATRFETAAANEVQEKVLRELD
jgi:hypothetical protein